MIRYVTKKDIDVWLQIATEVEPLFGKMVGCKDFEDGMNANAAKILPGSILQK